jgi:hypothetical protein
LDLAPLAIATVQALFRLSLKVLKLAPLFVDLSLLRLDLLLSLPMIVPVTAPMPRPPRVPFSRVESGCPKHPAIAKSATSANVPITIQLRCIGSLLTDT